MSARPQTPRRLLIVESNEARVAWLIDRLLGAFSVHRELRGPALATTIATVSPSLIILGESNNLDADRALLLLLNREEEPPTIYMTESEHTAALVPVSHNVHTGMSKDVLLQRITEALETPPPEDLSEPSKMTAGEAAGVQRLLEVAREFGSQRDLAGASRVLERTLLEFLDADRVHCLFYSAPDSSLWTETEITAWSSARDVSANTGIAGHVATTGQTIRLASAGTDTRYQKSTDDPDGSGTERLIAHALVDPQEHVHAVLVAVRSSKRDEFTPHDEDVCRWLTKQLAPLTAQLAMQIEVASVLEEAEGKRIFRQEAANAQATTGTTGDVVRVSPPWVSWAYWGLVVVLLGLGTFLALAEVPDYSTGPIVIREAGRTDVLAPVSGSVETVLVAPGDQVEAGQQLARFYSPEESTQLTRLELEWQASLRAYLTNRADMTARNAVSSLRLERNQLLELLTLRAPHGGVVNDIRATVGQHTERGESLLSISQPGQPLQVVAFLPGADRPQLEAGMSLRMTLHGYPQTHVGIDIESVSSDVMGPAEASRALGRGLVDSIQLPSSVVVVRGTLQQNGFEVDGQHYEYSHGMLGLAEVKLRSESVLHTLVPALRRR